MDCQPRSSKSSKPLSKGGREASHHEVGSVRQDPQGEESHSSNSLASSPSVSSVSRAQLGTSSLSVRAAAPYAARASQPSVNLPPTSIDHSNYVYCVSNMNDLLQNAAPASAAASSSSSASGKRNSAHEDHLSSLLPKHFSEMSQNSQQAVLEQLLASAQSDVAGGSGKSHDAPLSASGIVVSLPSHGSSLNMPESPGPPNKNDSGSVGSSNNTMVIHGSSSPDSPWSQQWSSSLLHNRGVSSAGSDAQRGKRASYDYHQHHSPATTLTSPELLRGGIERSEESVENLSSSSYLPSNSSYLPANSSYLPSNSSYLTTNSSYLASSSPYLAATTSNSYLPSYSSAANQSLNYSTSLSQSLSSELAARDQVLGYLGQSHISSIAHSALDQSEVLKHLLNSNTDASRAEGARRSRPDEAATLGSLGASKLTCNSSSCGSVHSGGLDNVTPTSGYSSASASTQFSLNRSGSNHRREGEQRAPPPAYTPNYALNRDVLLAREALRDISLGRGADLRDHKGRSAAREVRRDLSLGPEMTRRPRDNSVVQVTTRDSSAPPSTDSALSRSHPDLSRLEESREVQLSERLEASELPGVVDLLHRENTALRLELEIVSRKVNKLQKFEAEIVKMQAAHEGLVQSCSRREQLEKLARTKLQSQVQVLTRTNIDLKEELEALRVARDPVAGAAGVGATSNTTRETEESLRRELNRRDVIVAQLIAQNKELLAAKERLQMEVTAQKKTLHEQRSHIEVLDSALTSARLNVVKLEEEVRLKQGSVAELQAAADRRLQLLEARHERQLQDGGDRRDRSRERGSAHERQQHYSDRYQQQQPRSAAPRKDEELDAGMDGPHAAASGGRASQPPSASLPLLHIHEADGPPDYADPTAMSDHRMEDTSCLLKQGSVASARATPASDHGGPPSKGRPQDAEGSPAPWDHGDPPHDQDPSSEPVQLAQNHGKVSCSGSAAGLSVRSPSVHRSSTSPAHLFTHAREDGKNILHTEQLRKSPFSSEPKMPCANTTYGRPSVPTSQKFRYSCEPEISNERVREQDDRDRSNYTQYISRQFNKFRDATLSKNMNPKRLSYPLKHELMESIRKVDESHGNDQVCGRTQQQSSSNVGFGPRPHSANDLPTGSTVTSSGVHDYVNYCPGSCDQTRDVSELRVPYVYPPDYGSRGSNKPSTEVCERSNSFHSVTSNVRGNRHSYLQQQKQPESCLPQYPAAHPNKNSSYCENFVNNNFAETSSNSRLKVPHVRLTPPPPSPNAAAPLHYDRYNDYAVVYDANQFSCDSLMTSAMPVPRGNPPPYHSHHEILDSGPAARPVINTSGVVENPRPPSVSASLNHPHQSSSEFLNSSALRNSPFTVTPAEMCQTNHPPSTTCKTCNNARSTYRKNAANLVRRASSGASLLKRKSAKLRSSFHTEVDLDESPSILSRLRKEWQDRKGGSKSTGNIPTLGGASETSTSTSSYLSPAASVKPPESLRFELSAFSRSLSKKKWIIQENQAVGPGSSASEGSYVMCNDHANTPPLERNSRGRPLSVESASSGAVSLNADDTPNNERSVSQSSLCDSPGVPRSQTADPHPGNSRNCGGPSNAISKSECHYYDVEMSDNDSTYDTLIIKNVSELNDSNTTVGCDCADACSILSDPKHKTRTASKQHQADNVNVKS